MSTAWKFGVVALVALLFVLLPGGGPALALALTVLSIVFFTLIALLGYRLYREHNFALRSLETAQRLVLYGSIGLAFLTFTATPRLFAAGGLGVLAWVALLGASSYGVFWVFMRSRRYE